MAASPNTPIRHGSEYGYRQHKQRGEDACEECLRANVLATRVRQGKLAGPGRVEPEADPVVAYLRAKLGLTRRETEMFARHYPDVIASCERIVLSWLADQVPDSVLAVRARGMLAEATYGLCLHDYPDDPDRLCDEVADGSDGLCAEHRAEVSVAA